MFFEEQLNFEHKEKINFSTFNVVGIDFDYSFYESMQPRIFSRWKYHLIFAWTFIFILSSYYPIFFLFIFMEIICEKFAVIWFLNTFESHHSFDYYNLYLHKSTEGDTRISTYVFLCYDSLGYVIYGVSYIGENICSEIYEYDNDLGFYDKLKVYNYKKILNKLKINRKFKFKKKKNLKKIKLKYLYSNNDLLSFYDKSIVNINKLNLNKLYRFSNNFNSNKKQYNKKYNNYYILFNLDRCFSFFDSIYDKKFKN